MVAFRPCHWSGGYAVYRERDLPPGSALQILFLCPAVQQPTQPLSLAEIWAGNGPWALLVVALAPGTDPPPPDQLAQQIKLTTLGPDRTMLVWWPLGQPFCTLVLVPDRPNRQVLASTNLPFANVLLQVPSQFTVALASDNNGLMLTKNDSSGQSVLTRSDAADLQLTFDGFDLPFADSGNGVLGSLHAAQNSWQVDQIFSLGQDSQTIVAGPIVAPEIRYFQGKSGAAPARLRLPLFPTVEVGIGEDLTIDAALNPALPFDPVATRFLVTDPIATVQQYFTSSAGLMTRDGTALGLAPVSGIGFHFALGTVPGTSPATPLVYLAPHGRFRIAPPPTIGTSVFSMMPGLSGLERVETMAGDAIDFFPGQPAFGQPSSLNGNSSVPRLDGTCTTSWMRLVPAASRNYFAQPLASVFYASPSPTDLPRAADALVAQISGSEAPYPLAPYGNALSSGVDPDVTPDLLATFERTYLAGTRGGILGGSRPPVFSLKGKSLEGSSATPRGLFADVGPVPPAGPASRKRKTLKTAAPTPEGHWQRVYLGRGDTETVALEPMTETGAVDPALANALMQSDLFLVYTNWPRGGGQGHNINLVGELDVGGFSFNWADPKVMVVVKFTTHVSLKDLFGITNRWRDPDIFVGDANAIQAAQGVFQEALRVAEAARAGHQPLFDDFLDRIAGSADWNGVIAFNAPVDGNTMPPTLQILMAGMDTPLRAHHVAVDVSVVQAANGVPTASGPSSVAAVISYDRQSETVGAKPRDPYDPYDPYKQSPKGDGSDAYGFYTQSLKVGIASSVVTSFHAEVAVMANRLFGRPVLLEPIQSDPAPNTLLLKGLYHVIANVPTVTFVLQDARRFDFPTGDTIPGGELNRIIDHFKVTSAGIMPQAQDKSSKGEITHQAQITLNGGLWFASDPFNVAAPKDSKPGLDLFSYGTATEGLAVTNFGIHMTFKLDRGGSGASEIDFAVDYTRLRVTAPTSAIRSNSLLNGLPLTLKGIIADDKGLDSTKLGGQPVNCLDIADKTTSAPQFALQYELLIGSLGELSSVHAGLAAELRLCWGPRATIPDADGVLLTIQLPGVSAGFKDMNVQGFLKLVFGDANLMQVPYDGNSGGTAGVVYALLFNNVALSVMGIKLPPKVVSDLIMFSDPAQPGGSNLAGCLAVMQE